MITENCKGSKSSTLSLSASTPLILFSRLRRVIILSLVTKILHKLGRRKIYIINIFFFKNDWRALLLHLRNSPPTPGENTTSKYLRFRPVCHDLAESRVKIRLKRKSPEVRNSPKVIPGGRLWRALHTSSSPYSILSGRGVLFAREMLMRVMV